jgi:hypothetical protein
MKRPALVAGGFALIVALTGCGAQSVTGTPNPAGTSSGGTTLFGNAQDLVRAATAQTGKSKSAKFSIESSVAGQQLSGQGQGRFDGDNTAMQMKMNIGPVDEELRYVNKTLYIQLPAQYRAQATSGKAWGKLSADSPAAKAMGANQAEQNDPSKILDQIQQAGTITKSEQTVLDGQPVTHYWINVDVAKAMGQLSSAGLPPEQLDQIKTKVPTFPMELWLNGDMLPVQVTEDMTPLMAAAGAPASAGGLKMTMKYSDWGVPVDVQAPPADQVGDLKTGG